MRLRLRRRRGGSRARWTRPDESIRRFARVGALWGGGERTANGKNCDSLDGDADETQNLPAQVKEPLSLSPSLSLPSLSPTATPLCKVSREAPLADRGERGQRLFGFAGAERRRAITSRFIVLCSTQRCAPWSLLFYSRSLSLVPFLSSINQQAVSCSEL